MSSKFRRDARQDQLKILKLERRTMRHLAKTLLGDNSATKEKKNAVAATAAVFLSLQAAPEAFAKNLGLDPSYVSSTEAALEKALHICVDLNNGVESSKGNFVRDRVERLFEIIDEQHNRLEKLAARSGARLFSVEDGDEIGGGGGNKNDLTSWLTRSGM
ncbi:MAG: hypothetical protein AAGD92_06920 [Pseudomonadota bacterium]